MSDEYTLLPLDLDEEDDYDLALAHLDSAEANAIAVKSPRRPQLTPMQTLQVGIWIMEGFTNARIRVMMEEHQFPVLTPTRLQGLRHNTALIEESRQYLRKEIAVTGLAERAIRIRKLQRHADKLEALIDDTGLIEIGTKVVAFGKNVETLEERKFAALLSKEYRETIKQIKDEVEPLERVIIGEQNNIFVNITEDDRSQILAALKWSPSHLPQLLIEPPAEVLEAEVRVLESEA